MLQQLPSQDSKTQLVIYEVQLPKFTLTELVLVKRCFRSIIVYQSCNGFTQWNGIFEEDRFNVMTLFIAVHCLTTIDIKYKGMITTPCNEWFYFVASYLNHGMCWLFHARPLVSTLPLCHCTLQVIFLFDFYTSTIPGFSPNSFIHS